MSIHLKRNTLSVLLLLIIVAVGALWLTNRSVTPKESTWDDAITEAKNSGYRLVSTDELKQLYEKDFQKILLVDTRQEWEFATGHIKGAVNFPIEPTWWSRWWKKADLAATLGPDKDRLIVFY